MEYASNGKGNLGVTLGAIGTGLGVLNGGLGGILGGFGANPAAAQLWLRVTVTTTMSAVMRLVSPHGSQSWRRK